MRLKVNESTNSFDVDYKIMIDGKEAKIGDIVTDFRGDKVEIVSITKPGTPWGGRNGKISIKSAGSSFDHEVYPGVINAELVRVEDNLTEAKKCDKCNQYLSDNGECPYCDHGEEDLPEDNEDSLLDEAVKTDSYLTHEHALNLSDEIVEFLKEVAKHEELIVGYLSEEELRALSEASEILRNVAMHWGNTRD